METISNRKRRVRLCTIDPRGVEPGPRTKRDLSAPDFPFVRAGRKSMNFRLSYVLVVN